MATESVQLIFSIKAENQATLASLRQAVSGVNSELAKGTSLSAALANVSGNLVVSLKALGSAANNAAAGTSNHTASMSDSILKGIVYSEILGRIANAVKEVTVESALYAARTQQLNVVMDQLARVNGLSVTAVRQQADAVKSYGISTQESREVISRMIFSQLDLAKATDLTRLAQNAAKIAGISSSEALSGIVLGITEQRVQILRTYGIQVQFEQALIRGAAALGKTRESLTDAERSNIALNEVLSKGPRILGTYEVSLSTAAGQLQSMKRYVDEARNALGEGFLPVLQRVVQFLTNSTKDVSENADAYGRLATHITSVSLALLAAKLTPGGPAAKIGVGAAVGIATELIAETDPVEQQVKFSQIAVAKVQTERKELQKRFQNGLITDKEEYLSEDKRLAGLQITIQQNLTDALAVEYKKRQEDAGKGSYYVDFGKGTFGQGISIKRGDAHRGLGQGNKSGIPDVTDLGSGIGISRASIEAAIRDQANPKQFEPGNLKITPNPSDAVDAVLSQFTMKAKEAKKTAEGGVDRAKEGLLTGEDKIEAQRADALKKLAEDFKQFTTTFKSALERQGDIKDPKQREQMVETIRVAQSQYGAIVAQTNRQFDLERKKDRQTDSVEAINNAKKIADARFEIGVQSDKQGTANQDKLSRAGRFPGNEEGDIKQEFLARIDAAKKEREESKQRDESDLNAAKAVFAINKDDKALNTANTAYRIAELKAEASLLKESTTAEVDRQVSILELRKKQRQELAASIEVVKSIDDEQTKLDIKRGKDSVDRFVKLAQAQATTPGEQIYATNLGLAQKRQAAISSFNESKKQRQDDEDAARKEFANTGNKEALERAAGKIRKDELQADYDLEKAMLDLRLDKEIQIAEIRKQQAEQLRGLLGSLYDDLGKNGRGIKFFLQDQLDALKKQLFVNTGSILFKGALQQLGGIIPGQQQIDPATGKPTGELTTIGKILQGTILGVDPAKLAAAQQIKAVDRNTKALDDLTGILTGQGGSSIGGSNGSYGNNSGSWGGWSRPGGGGFPEISPPIFGGGWGSQFLASGGSIIPGSNLPGQSGGGGSSPGGWQFPDWPGGNGGGNGGGSNNPASIPSNILKAFGGGVGALLPLLLASKGNSAAKGAAVTGVLKQLATSAGVFKPGSIFGPRIDIQGNPEFAPLQTGLAAALALPQILGGFSQGGVGGVATGIGGILGAAATIPGPQAPFLAGASAILSLLGPLIGHTRYQEWQKNLNNRLNSKFQASSPISLTQDLAGNSVDYDYLGNQRAFSGNPSTTIPSGPLAIVQVSTMDSRSFADNSGMISDAVQSQLGLGHPLLKTIQDIQNG